jgi:hypothetical protein
MRWLMGCLRRLIGLAVILVVIGAAYLYRDRLALLWYEVKARFGATGPVASSPVASEELAVQAAGKLASLAGGQSDRASFSGLELQSLLEYRYQQLLPGFVDSPRVEIDDSRLRLHMRVPVDRIPASPEFEDVAPFLPDTANLAVRGQLIPVGEGIAFAVDELTAQRIPLPSRMVPGALAMLGREDAPGLPEDAIAIPLPRGVRVAYLRADSLILLSGVGQPRN